MPLLLYSTMNSTYDYNRDELIIRQVLPGTTNNSFGSPKCK
jgi:hypothetical protein